LSVGFMSFLSMLATGVGSIVWVNTEPGRGGGKWQKAVESTDWS
jgi:hypothetical protein